MEEIEVNNLEKFGADFQIKCVSALLTDRAFMERVADILSPDYFEHSAHRWIVKEAAKYFIKYKELPTPTVLKVEVEKIEVEELMTSLTDALKTVYTHKSDTDIVYIKEEFLEFCKNQKLRNAVIKSAEYLERGEFEKIKEIIDDALKAGMERNIGHDYFNEIDHRMSEMARSCVKTHWEPLDDLMDGGLGKGELGFIVGPSGSGKSWLLARLGAEAMRQGKNVLHFTMELNENYVGLRYDACFTGIPFQEIRDHIDIVKKRINDVKGKLFIKYFPTKTVSPATLKLHVERLQLVTGIKIDMIIVDYADLLRPLVLDKNANTYLEAGSVYEELRGVAGEFQIPVWSASQANRSAHESDKVGAENVADSYKKVMTGDFIISLSRTTEDKSAGANGDGTARIHVIKNRFGCDGLTFPCKFNTSTGNLIMFEPKSPEGEEMLNATASKAKSTYEKNKEKPPGMESFIKNKKEHLGLQPPTQGGIETE